MTEPNQDVRIMLNIDPAVEPGVYASFVAVWHYGDAFTLDFASVTAPGRSATDEETGAAFVEVPAKIVSRVKIPVSQVFEIMKALEQQLSKWELETGNRKPS
jgi:hypothetical protein